VNLVNYNDYGNINSSSVVYYQLLSIFGIVKEILKERNVADHTGELNIEKLTSFIHENIYDRDKLAVKLISENFNISPTYFSNYFKRHFKISYQEYLNNYRVTLIEKRLNMEGLKLKQIAEEFGFTDTSHLSKTFKKIKGVTPQNYLKSIR
jgi:AraC-like DNA-binding protein